MSNPKEKQMLTKVAPMRAQAVQGSWKTHVLCKLLDQFADCHDKLAYGAAPTTLLLQSMEGEGNCKRTVYSAQTNSEDERSGESGEHFCLYASA